MGDLADRRDVETEVYQPAEDSQLLLEAARQGVTRADLVLEVGTGSGYVAAALATGTGARVVGSDRNPHACRAARERGIETVRGDLVGPFRDEIFDAVLFNPPYLPRVDAAEREDWMESALTGGETGREVSERFVASVGRVLAPGGRVWLVASTVSGVAAIETVAQENGFATEQVAEEPFPFETLVVLELTANGGA